MNLFGYHIEKEPLKIADIDMQWSLDVKTTHETFEITLQVVLKTFTLQVVLK